MPVLGAIVRADIGSGLQTQSYALTRMLQPSSLLIVDSTSFNHAEQDFSIYDSFKSQTSNGFPTNLDSARFVRGLTHIITAETIYNPRIYELAKIKNIKVFTQLNWEFLDHLVNPRIPKPHKWLMPSYWMLEEMKEKFSNTEYLPPPIIMDDFKKARDKNSKREGKRKFLHVVGKVAHHDRNGTFDLIDSLKYSTGDFDLIIRSQYPIAEYMNLCKDERVTFEVNNIKNHNDLYEDFDVLIIPRRYGGLCLPMNEGLASALPVIMTDISPNDKILPHEWLVPVEKTHTFLARTHIDVHKSDIISLGKKIDWFANMKYEDLHLFKRDALNLAYDNYSSEILKPKYLEIMGL